MKLDKDFFNRPTLQVSRDLLGKFMVRVHRGRPIAGMITETEAYIGPRDMAAHSRFHKGRKPQKWQPKFEDLLRPHVGENAKEHFMKWAATGAKITPRTIAEYLDGGTIYIYLVYGMYWNMNLSTAGPGIPECVLLRAAVPVSPKTGELDRKRYELADGPGKLCKYFRTDKSFYAESVCDSNRIWLEDGGVVVPERRILKGPRIGIDYAGPYWMKKPWRFRVEPFN